MTKNISGLYQSQHGDVQIFQEGEDISGTYGDKGRFNGILKDNTVNGIWSNDKHQGLFKWIFDEAGNFTGVYKIGDEVGPMRSKWNGTLLNSEMSNAVSEEKESLKSEIKDFTDEAGNSYRGRWENGEMVFAEFTLNNGFSGEGNFKDFLLHGSAKLNAWLEDGTKYSMEGNWESGQFISGKRIYENGNVEEGEFNNLELQGKGKKIIFEEDEKILEEGDFFEGKLNGNGIRQYENGNKYEGYFQDDNFWEGESTLYHKDGSLKFKGAYSNGVKEGYGTFIYLDGTKYAGEFLNGKFDGPGKISWANGDYKSGLFEAGQFINGKGKVTNENEAGEIDFIYEGAFIDDEFNGFGILTIPGQGYRYEGQFLNGKSHGEGKGSWDDGDFQDGLWEEDKFISGAVKIHDENSSYTGEYENGANGDGRRIYTNGDYEEGLFFNNRLLSGKARKSFNNGDIYEGGMLAGEMNDEDKAVYIWKSGTKYEGQMSNGYFHGNGRKVWTNGDYKDGLWELDCFVSGEVRITENDGSFYEGSWENDMRYGYGRWENPKTGEYEDGMWDEDGIFSGNIRRLVKGKLVDIDALKLYLEHEWAKEEARIRKEEAEKARIAAELKAEREKEEKAKAKEAARIEKEEAAAEREWLKKQKEIAQRDKKKEAEKRNAETARIKEAAAAEKDKIRFFKVTYKIKLTQAKSKEELKGREFGMVGIILNGAKTEKIKTHDKGESISRDITIKYQGLKIPIGVVRDKIETHDADVRAGRAGTSTIKIVEIREVNSGIGVV